ncbi:MAG TPA: hypothetical protein VII16_06385 [Actinomycetes bacterium]|jgi:hypothetical protein
MHHDPTTASLAAVAVHLQLGSTLPQVAADGGRKADPRGLVVLRVLVPVAGDEARAAARVTITGTAAALRQLLAAMAVEVGKVDPDPDLDPEPPLLTRPHDTLPESGR